VKKDHPQTITLLGKQVIKVTWGDTSQKILQKVIARLGKTKYKGPKGEWGHLNLVNDLGKKPMSSGRGDTRNTAEESIPLRRYQPRKDCVGGAKLDAEEKRKEAVNDYKGGRAAK